MNLRLGIPLSTLLLAVFLFFGLGGVWLVREAIDLRQQQVVSELGRKESRQTAEQIYQHLYSVMRKGWSRAEIIDTLARIRATHPDIDVHLVRSATVADQFGDIPSARHARANDPAVRDSLARRQGFHAEHDGLLRYIMPLVNQAECAECHTNPRESVNGVIDIRIHAENLRAPIQATISPLLNLVSLFVLGLFVAIFFLLRLQIVGPISGLTRRMQALTHDIEHGGQVDIRPAWPREVQTLAGQFNHLLGEVRDTQRRLTELAVRDKLTGLYNRRYFDEMLARTLDQARRNKQPLALLMLDLDDFKPLNDQCGHALGDQVLADIGRTLLDLTRDGDICSRVGGDEFLLIGVDCDEASAQVLAHRLREGIAGLTWHCDGRAFKVSASIGVATYPEHAEELAPLLAFADEQMYRSKRQRKLGIVPAAPE
jgi:diguanylate cyclase (GGDEF)-like protein